MTIGTTQTEPARLLTLILAGSGLVTRYAYTRLVGNSSGDEDRDPPSSPQSSQHRSTDPVREFFESLNEADADRLTRCLHPDFELVVPQRPARGFRGREREVSNMQGFFDTYPDFCVRVLRRVDAANEVWTESEATATGLEMAAVIIWTIDDVTGTLAGGRYYSDTVQHDAEGMEDFIRSLGVEPRDD